jgi:hypothetical protein
MNRINNKYLVEVVRAIGGQASRQRLAVDNHAASLGVRDRQRARLAHHIHNIQRTVELLGDADRTLNRLGLELLRPAQQVTLGSGHAQCAHSLGALLGQIAALRVHHGHTAELLASPDHSEELVLSEHEQLAIGHVHEERVDAMLAHTRLHVLGRLVRERRDTRVEGVVTAGLGRGALASRRHGLAQRDRPVLAHTRQHTGGAAGHRGARGRGEVVGGARAHKHLLEVGVGVDAARHDQLAARLYGLDAARHDQVLAHVADHAVLDVHVRVERLVVVDHSTALDQNAVLRVL